MRGLCFSQKVLTSCAGSSKRERTGAHQNGPGGAGSGEERKMQRRESLLRAPVYEEVCLARGRLEMRLGRFFLLFGICFSQYTYFSDHLLPSKKKNYAYEQFCFIVSYFYSQIMYVLHKFIDLIGDELNLHEMSNHRPKTNEVCIFSRHPDPFPMSLPT